MYKSIWCIERILHFSPCTTLYYESRIMHFREILWDLWRSTVCETCYFSRWKTLYMEEKIDDFETAIRRKRTKNLRNLLEFLRFLEHFCLYFFEVGHRIIVITLSFYEIIKLKQIFVFSVRYIWFQLFL